MTQSRAYIYEALPNPDDIRLILLHPGSLDNDDITCEILLTSLANHPSFEALSYTWGTEHKTESIQIGPNALKITANLHSALKHLRHVTEIRVLWADAICINQADDAERSKQVRIMGNIYSKADRTVVWLGEGFDGDKDAFALVSKFAQGSIDDNVQIFIEPLALEDIEVFLKDFNWVVLDELLSRKWFTRMWVIQEVAVAREVLVVCGTLCCSWETMEKFAIAILTNVVTYGLSELVLARTLSNVICISNIRRAFGRFGKRDVSIWVYLKATILFLATDPRDRVYSLLGLVLPERLSHLVVDYTLPWESLYTKLSQEFYQSGRVFNILSFSGTQRQTAGITLPSWVVDWSLDPMIYEFLYSQQELMYDPSQYGFEAGTGSEIYYNISEDSMVLTLRGVIFDSVATLTEEKWEVPLFIGTGTEAEKIAQRSNKNILFNSCDRIAAQSRPYRSGDELTKSYSALLAFGGIPGMSQDELVLGYHNTRTLCRWYENPEAFMLEFCNDCNAVKDRYLRHITLWALGRRFFASSKKYLGWTADATRVGDVICVFYGANVPYVLRPNDDGTFKLIGECYTHGIMKGEALRMEDLEHQYIRIT